MSRVGFKPTIWQPTPTSQTARSLWLFMWALRHVLNFDIKVNNYRYFPLTNISAHQWLLNSHLSSKLNPRVISMHRSEPKGLGRHLLTSHRILQLLIAFRIDPFGCGVNQHLIDFCYLKNRLRTRDFICRKLNFYN